MTFPAPQTMTHPKSILSAFALAACTLSASGQQIAQDAPRPDTLAHPADSDHGRRGGSGDFTSDASSEQPTHLTIGRSIVVDTRHRLTKVYITNPEVLESYTANPNQVVLTAKKPGISTMMLWDESGEAKSYLISADLNVEALRKSLSELLPNEQVTATANEGTVVLSGTVGSEKIADAAVKLATTYSTSVSNALLVSSGRVKQVRLEVKIIEVDRTRLSTFGFNFFSNGGNNVASTATGQFPSTLSVTGTGTGQKTVTIGNPLNFSIYSSKLNVGATLQDLATMQAAQILAEPNIVAMSGQSGNFLAGGEFPFPVVQSTSTGAPSVTIMFRPYGVKLDFAPVVNPDGSIQLKVAPEVSALDFTNAVNIAGYTIPALSTRRAETQLVLQDGQTFAISGLLDRRTTDQYEKTPGIANVPILGQLFRSKNVNHTDTELVVFVTPRIVQAQSDGTPVEQPKQVVKPLDIPKFDKDFPGDKLPATVDKH